MSYKYILLIAGLLLSGFTRTYAAVGDADWRERATHLIYSPRYFGPNALPIPTLHSASVSNRWEVEFRGEYHHYTGDKTKIYGMINASIASFEALTPVIKALPPLIAEPA